MQNQAPAQVPDALLLLANGCPHCPTVLAGLSELVKQGKLGRLEVININQHPEAAAERGVRAVPWVRLGPFELAGLRSPAELAQWAERSGSVEGMSDYFTELLTEGNLTAVSTTVHQDPGQAAALIRLLGDPEAELQIRLGAAAVIEDLEGSDTLRAQVAALGDLTRHSDPRIRADACHALALSHAPTARALIEALLQDNDTEVREVAEESLAIL